MGWNDLFKAASTGVTPDGDDIYYVPDPDTGKKDDDKKDDDNDSQNQ